MDNAIKRLHSIQPQHFPIQHRLQHYKEQAEHNYRKGCFYQKALLPQFHISSREEAYQLIQEQGQLLTADALIHGDACLPNFILKDAATFSSLALVIATLTFTGRSGLLLIIYLILDTQSSFLTTMAGRMLIQTNCA